MNTDEKEARFYPHSFVSSVPGTVLFLNFVIKSYDVL